MAQLVLGAVGAVVGAYFGNPALGWAIGSAIGGAAFPPKSNVKGPQITDLRVNGLEYGQTIPYTKGAPTMAGQIWWASDRREIATTTTEGGKGGPEVDSTTFTYEVDLLVGFTYNEMAGLAKILIDGKLEYNVLDGGIESAIESAGTTKWRRVTFYPGDFEQLPDPTYEAAVGIGNAPAYRGRCYLFFEAMQLGSSGRVPNIQVMLFSKGTASGATWHDDTTSLAAYVVDSGSNNSSVVAETFGSTIYTPPRDSLTIDKIRREITPVTMLYMECKILLDTSVGDDDATSLRFTDESTPSLLDINPYRETAEDSLRRLHVNGNPMGSQALPLGQLVLFQMQFDPDAGSALQTATNLETGDVIFSDTDLSFPLLSTITRQMFVSDATIPGHTTTGVAFSDILIVGVLAEVEDETVEDVVTALCERSGMQASQFDASALSAITRPVRAVVVSQITSTRQILEYMGSCWFFDSYSTDRQYFVPRGGAPVATIPFESLGATESADPADSPFDITIGSELELPASATISYMNIDTDCTRDSQYSDRQNTESITTTSTEVPFGFTAEEAKQIVDAWLLDQRVARYSSTLALLTQDAAAYTPTDVFYAVDEEDNQFRLRAVSRKESGPVVTFDVVLDDATVLDQLGITSADYSSPTTVVGAAVTVLYVLDVPILRDADDGVGLYVAARGQTSPWGGAAVFESPDGVTYDRLDTVTESATLGLTVTVLADWTHGNEVDEISSVEVRMTGTGTLDSVSHDAMLTNQANAALIGSEVIQFRDAEPTSDGVYLLTGLLRGRRGTDWATSSHALSEPFTLLTPAGMRRIDLQTSDIGATRYWIGVTLGQLLSSAPSQALEFDNVGQIPFSPVDIRCQRATTSNIAVLLHFDGANTSTTFTNSSLNSHTFTPLGNAQISTAQSVFGGSAALFDGTGDNITTPDTTDLNIGVGVDFVIDVRVRLNSTAANQLVFIKATGAGNYPYRLIFQSSDTKFHFQCTSGGSVVVNIANTSTITTGVWYRVTCRRVGNLYTIEINGSVENSTTNANALLVAADPLSIGADSAGGSALNGYVDEFILVNGSSVLPGDGTIAYPDPVAGSGAATITWSRRTRLATNFNESICPLGEASEAYEADIYSNSGFSVIKRTFTGLTSASLSYTKAQQETDFGVTQSTIYLRVYQLSETMGRGYAGQAAV